MIFLFVVVFALCDAKPGYSDSSYAGNHLGSGGADGSSYGYAGSYSGAGGFPPGNVPSFVPFIPQFDFSSFFEQLNRQHQEFIQHGGGVFSYSYASSKPGGGAQAQSTIIFDISANHGIQKLAEGQANAGSIAGPGTYAPGFPGSAQGAAGAGASGYGGGVNLGNRGGFVGGYGGGFSGPDGNSYSFSGPIGGGGGDASGAAFASGAIGPDGVQQTASVYPENPNIPNVNTRFGGESSGGGGGGGGGFKSVFTSSKSVSSNINGKPQNFREASTTVNDNGKITTYTARNP